MTTVSSTFPMPIVPRSSSDDAHANANWARRREPDETPELADRARRVERLRRLAVLLDSSIKIPGVNFTVGVDPILGLVPGVGDVISAGLAAYVVYEGHKLGATRAQMTKMIANVVIDTAAGFVPVIGDIFDFAFKANVRNLRILGIDPQGMGVKVGLD